MAIRKIMKNYIFAKNLLTLEHVGSLVHVKEIFYSTTGKVVCKEYESCIITNFYEGLMLKCCILLSNNKYLVYDLDSKHIHLYVAFPEDYND